MSRSRLIRLFFLYVFVGNNMRRNEVFVLMAFAVLILDQKTVVKGIIHTVTPNK